MCLEAKVVIWKPFIFAGKYLLLTFFLQKCIWRMLFLKYGYEFLTCYQCSYSVFPFSSTCPLFCWQPLKQVVSCPSPDNASDQRLRILCVLFAFFPWFCSIPFSFLAKPHRRENLKRKDTPNNWAAFIWLSATKDSVLSFQSPSLYQSLPDQIRKYNLLCFFNMF